MEVKLLGYMFADFIIPTKAKKPFSFIKQEEIGTTINQLGRISNSTGQPIYKEARESKPIHKLPYNTLVHITGAYKYYKGWVFIRAISESKAVKNIGGWVPASSIAYPLPDPGTQLYNVKKGDTLLKLIRTYEPYKELIKNGEDARLLVHAIGNVNEGRNGVNYNFEKAEEAVGFVRSALLTEESVTSLKVFKSIRIVEGSNIWLPSAGLIKRLKKDKEISSGSIKNTVKYFAQKMNDIKKAIKLSGKYLPGAIKRRAFESLEDVLTALAIFLVIAIGVLGVTTAVGAIIGSLAGGVGAGPGAAAGFQFGLTFLGWLGLGFLMVWLATSLYHIGGVFFKFLGEAWEANGDRKKLEKAAQFFADYIAQAIAFILEAIVFLVLGKFLPKILKKINVLKKIKNSRFGKWVGKRKFGKWLKKKLNKVKSYQFRLEIPEKVINKIPFKWKPGQPTRDGVGYRWHDPSNPKRNGVRIDKGNLNRDFETQFVDHVVVRSGGEVLGRNGKPIQGSIADNGETAHIPLSEYIKWKSWNQK